MGIHGHCFHTLHQSAKKVTTYKHHDVNGKPYQTQESENVFVYRCCKCPKIGYNKNDREGEKAYGINGLQGNEALVGYPATAEASTRTQVVEIQPDSESRQPMMPKTSDF